MTCDIIYYCHQSKWDLSFCNKQKKGEKKYNTKWTEVFSKRDNNNKNKNNKRKKEEKKNEKDYKEPKKYN